MAWIEPQYNDYMKSTIQKTTCDPSNRTIMSVLPLSRGQKEKHKVQLTCKSLCAVQVPWQLYTTTTCSQPHTNMIVIQLMSAQIRFLKKHNKTNLANYWVLIQHSNESSAALHKVYDTSLPTHKQNANQLSQNSCHMQQLVELSSYHNRISVPQNKNMYDIRIGEEIQSLLLVLQISSSLFQPWMQHHR